MAREQRQPAIGLRRTKRGIALTWLATSWQTPGAAVSDDEGRTFVYLLTGPYTTYRAFVMRDDEFVVLPVKNRRSDCSAGINRWIAQSEYGTTANKPRKYKFIGSSTRISKNVQMSQQLEQRRLCVGSMDTTDADWRLRIALPENLLGTDVDTRFRCLRADSIRRSHREFQPPLMQIEVSTNVGPSTT